MFAPVSWLSDHTRPGDLSSVDGRVPALEWGDWSEAPDDAEDDEEGDTPAEVVDNSGAPVAPLLEPFTGTLFTLLVAMLADVEVKIPATVDGGITPPRPPSLEYVSSSDMSPDARWGVP